MQTNSAVKNQLLFSSHLKFYDMSEFCLHFSLPWKIKQFCWFSYSCIHTTCNWL